MREPMAIVLVPGLLCSARLYYEQLSELWRCGPAFIADHRRDDTLTAVALRLLDTAPPRFAIVGLSIGVYVAFEVWRRTAERVAMLGLLNSRFRTAAICPHWIVRAKSRERLSSGWFSH